MACTGMMKITSSGAEKFGLSVELGLLFLPGPRAQLRAWSVLLGLAVVSSLPKGCVGTTTAFWKVQPLRQGFAFKINWPFVGDPVLSMMEMPNVLTMQLETDPQGLCIGVLNVIVSRNGIGWCMG